MTRDRRAVVFLVFAAIAFALTPVAESRFRWVCIATGVIYVLLSVGSALNHRSRSRL